MTIVDWKTIMTEFTQGKKLKDLAGKYNIPFETIKSRHRNEKWSIARSEYKRKLNEKVTNELAKRDSPKILDEIEVIDYTVKHLAKKLPDCEASNAEGIGRAISELLKTRGLYTGETSEKHEHSGQVEVIPLLGGDSNKHALRKNNSDRSA